MTEVSVRDVLLEATEYLSKLGSNLKIRSDNLKEKRVNKHKLKNTHAVHKAAKKILLICELSKKSLENVETGVNKILDACGFASKSYNDNLTDEVASPDEARSRRSSDIQDLFKYMTLDSKTFKIPKKVPIKHYMSCKVVVNKMPRSQQDVYPVYHDCKLYRLRKNRLRQMKSDSRENVQMTFNKNEIVKDVDLTEGNGDSECITIDHSKERNYIDSYNASQAHDKDEHIENAGMVREKLKDDNKVCAKIPHSKKPLKKSRFKHVITFETSSSSDTEVEKTLLIGNKTDDRTRTNGSIEKLDDIQINNERDCSETEFSCNLKEKDLVTHTTAAENINEIKVVRDKERKQNLLINNDNDINENDYSSECDISTNKINAVHSEESIHFIEESDKVENQNKLKTTDCDAKDDQENNTNDNSTEIFADNHNKEGTRNIMSSTDEEKNKKKSKEKRKTKDDQANNINEENTNVIVENDNEEENQNQLISTDPENPKNETKENQNTKAGQENNINESSSNIEKSSENDTQIENVQLECNQKDQDSVSINCYDFPNNTKHNEDGPKFMIKCVDISKLLKPGVILEKNPVEDGNDNKMSINKLDRAKEPTYRSKIREQERKANEAMINKKVVTNKKVDTNVAKSEEKQKINRTKLLVKNFKLKKFDVEISRLPKFTTEFLKQNNLRKIMQDGNVIIELVTAQLVQKEKNATKDNNEKSADHRSNDTNNVKHYLLNDSDSDCDVGKSETNTANSCQNEKVKKALLYSSNSDVSAGESNAPKSEDTTKISNSHENNNLEKEDSCHGSVTSKDNNANPEIQSEKNNKENSPKTTEESSVKTTEENSDKTAEENLGKIAEENLDKTAEENLHKTAEENLHKTAEENLDKTAEENLDKTAEENLAKTAEEISKENSHKTTEVHSDKSTDETSKETIKDNSHNNERNNQQTNEEHSHKITELSSSDTECHKNCNLNTPKKKSHKNREDLNSLNRDNVSPSTKDKEKTSNVKKALLDSSESSREKTPRHKRKHSEGSTPQSKRKHIMESMHAKRMLLTYSSSSDTDDGELRNALKEIKESLLKGITSSEDEARKPPKENVKESHRRTLLASSSDSDDILEKLNQEKMNKRKENTVSDNSQTDDAKKKDDKGSGSKTSSITQVDGNMDDSSSEMGRTRDQAGASTDTQDPTEKDIEGLTNLKSLNKVRRRKDSSSTSKSDDTSSNNKNKKKMPKVSVIPTEHLLKASSNSSLDPSDHENDLEELPVITGLNGDSTIDNLCKDDLLEESDDSSDKEKDFEHNQDSKDKSDSEKETDEDDLKIRRRRDNAISSDSEGGSTKKKDNFRISDFEDSEDDNSEPVKRVKRKVKRITDSDASAGDSSNDGNKKKRRRIKQINDTDASGSESETEGRKHGRKNIRKVMGKDQLEEATKKAAREEKERIARINDRQKLYNNMQFDESGKADEVVLEKVVLDFDPETKEPLIEVDRGLVKKLKPHQANGIKFMWDACFESVKRIKKDRGSGCILAHCMGLGKTLQVVSLTHTLLTHRDLTGVNRVLVVCPLSTVLNWVHEFRMWLKFALSDYEVDVYELSRYKQNSERAYQLQEWFVGGGVCVLGYEMFRNLSSDNAKKYRKKMLKSFQESLVDPGPDLVVCDEGHLLKNEKTSLSQSMNRVKTRRRIVLTGTPLQNNLKEYYCMVQFVKPNLLGKYNEYLNRFVNPITNGQYTDSTEHDIKIMKRRSHVLHKMLDGGVQRRDYGVLAPFLPPKHEYVLFITLTEIQTKLYQYYLDNISRRPQPGKSSGFLFPDFQSLQRIWTHPLVLKYNSVRYEIMQQKKRDKEEEDSEGSLVDFIDDESTPEETSSEEMTDNSSDLSDGSSKKSKKVSAKKKNKARDSRAVKRGTRANPNELAAEEDKVVDLDDDKIENPTEWWVKLICEEELEDLRHSHKLVLLFHVLRECEAIGDKLLVFSQSLYSLDLIEHFLGKVDEATQEGKTDEKLGGHVGSWSPGIDYFRLDGSTSCENRSIWCKNFNREDNPRARLFLISTRAGGLGINLVAANRVIIFDVSWNPSHDVQSIFRVYRFGQKKPCYVYRFLAMGTMEEKIYERQVTKQAISKRVIDEQQIDRHYAENDLAELYKFEPSPSEPRPLPPLPKDRLFAEMLKAHDKQIYRYHEHDSLLENKEEETLTEEERKAAWEDFENEKNRPPPVPFANTWPMHNGMVPGMMAQQQQQLALAALAGMLRKDYPNMTDQQLANMLPIIYNSNPGLMQKMSDIYKYPQAGMMNPMMNVMNPAMNSGVMGSSTNNIQYEPPWQRQQTQQHQMRLNQLMQQQNLGAKYYSGGLGSRDPMAMAIQQQRTREIMMNEQLPTRGRPRGRPPGTSNVPYMPTGVAGGPATSSSEVVNLDDSD